MKDKQEIYISTDVETDGPIPGPNSMLSFGSAAFKDGALIDTFSANLELLADAQPDPSTADFWRQNQKAYDVTRVGMVAPERAMHDYVAWVRDLPGTPVFVAYPAGFDFLFMYWYMTRFGAKSPFSFSALDIKTYAMATLKCGYREAVKRRFPKRWFSKRPHTHVALDDAIEQGELFMAMLTENAGRSAPR